jgi:hypothetical protein
MSFTYDSTDLTDPISAFRLRVADTTEATALFQDEEIQFFLDEGGSVDSALALAYAHLANRYTRMVNFEIGGLKVEYASRALYYQRLADAAAAVIVPVVPILAGAAVSGALHPHYFTSDLMDTVYTGKDETLDAESP